VGHSGDAPPEELGERFLSAIIHRGECRGILATGMGVDKDQRLLSNRGLFGDPGDEGRG